MTSGAGSRRQTTLRAKRICGSVAGYGTKPTYMGHVESMTTCNGRRLADHFDGGLIPPGTPRRDLSRHLSRPTREPPGVQAAHGLGVPLGLFDGSDFNPDSDEYKALFDGDFADYRLRINGLVDNPVDLDLAQLRALPQHEQITQHFCIQGWSGVAKWGGVSMQTIVDLVEPHPEAKWVVFYSLGDGADKGVYYDAHPIEHMSHHLTMLAYDMNDEPLSFGHGAPLRLRNEIELGFKQVKWIRGIEFVAHYSEVGGGYGGYNQDHEFFGYRQSI